MHNENDIAGVSEGDVLAGKYRIDKVLGVGGMGVVVAAHHIHLDDRVAIKFMLPHALTNGEAVSRFAREARAAVKIKSEHVARVSDVGTLENGAPYMVMEYLEGRDLAQWIQQSGVLPIEQAVDLVLQALEALAEAHTLGIVHRDLKPANLFVIRTRDGQLSVKVLDFGISKMTRSPGVTPSSDMDMTKTNAMMGSPLYMSPEQMQSAKGVDARVDIWAVGVILYEILAGRVPFGGDSLPEVLMGIMSAEPDPPRSRRPDLPHGLERVILKCLAKDRDQRYPTVAALAGDLLPFAPRRSKVSLERISGIMQAAGLSATALPPSSDAAERALAGAGTEASWGQTADVGSRKTRTWVLGGAAAAGIVVVAGALYLLGGSEPVGPASALAASATSAAPAGHPTAAPSARPQPVALPVKPPEVIVEPVATSVPVVVSPKPEGGKRKSPKAQLMPSVPVKSAVSVATQLAPPAAATSSSKPATPAASAKAAVKPTVFDDR